MINLLTISESDIECLTECLVVDKPEKKGAAAQTWVARCNPTPLAKAYLTLIVLPIYSGGRLGFFIAKC